MSTVSQCNKYLKRLKRKRSYRLRVFNGAPQKKGVCLFKTYICTPKKPNSGKRKINKVRLSTGFNIVTYVCGENEPRHEGAIKGTNKLSKFSTVLVRFGKTQDLPGVKFKCIRGKYDFKAPDQTRTKKRSKYGLKKKKT